MSKQSSFIVGFAVLIAVLFFSLSFTSAYTKTVFDFSSSSSPTVPTATERNSCDLGQDFIVQIQPFGCEPAVVRSDLLAEQDVPVRCQLSATQLNPLIDVNSVDGVSVTGDYTTDIARFGFHPAKGALGGYFSDTPLNSPVLNNIGYAEIVLRKQPNESALPDVVTGNLTVTVHYDVEDAFGLGSTSFYLPQLTDDEWETQAPLYSFYNGEAFLRFEGFGLTQDDVQIGFYDASFSKFDEASLGRTTGSQDEVFLPGFSCIAGLTVTLDDLLDPDTTAHLRLDGNNHFLRDGDRFLDNKCRILDIDQRGLSESVTIACSEDDLGFFDSNDFQLSIHPSLQVEINGEVKQVKAGDYLFKSGNKYYYLAFIGTQRSGEENNLNELYVRLLAKPNNPSTLSEADLDYVSELDSVYGSNFLTFDDLATVLTSAYGLSREFFDWLRTGNTIDGMAFAGGAKTFGGDTGVTFEIKGFGEPTDAFLSPEFTNTYHSALDDYDELLETYPSLQNPDDPLLETTTGERALASKIALAYSLDQKRSAVLFCEEFVERYPASSLYPSVCKNERLLSSELFSSHDVLINNKLRGITFEGITEPSEDVYSATVSVAGPNGNVRELTFTKDKQYYLDEFRDDQTFTLTKSAGKIAFRYSSAQGWGFQGKNNAPYIVSLGNVTNLTNVQRSLLLEEQIRTLFSSLNSGELTLEEEKRLLRSYGASSPFESLELKGLDLDPDVAVLDAGLLPEGLFQQAFSVISADPFTLTLNKGEPQSLNGYTFLLEEVTLKREAKVSLTSSVNYDESVTTFPFSIGVEKRAIPLTPDQARSILNKVNATLDTLKSVSDNLGTAVKTLKAACVGVGGALTLKNLIFNAKGEGIARQTVMRGVGGWNERCQELVVVEEQYSDVNQCFLANADSIDAEVDSVKSVIDAQNAQIKQLEEGITQQGLLEDTVDTDMLVQRYSILVQDRLDAFGTTLLDPQNPNDASKALEVADIKESISYDVWKERNLFSVEELREMDLYLRLLEQDQNNAFARQRLYSLSTSFKTNSDEVRDVLSFTDTLNQAEGLAGVAVDSYGREDSIEGVYRGGKAIGAGYGSIPQGENVQGIRYNNKKYLLTLEKTNSNEYGIKNIYTESGQPIDVSTDPLANEILSRFRVFKTYDAESYQNVFKSPQVKYYETDPYQGLPSLVPFNRDGWYAATKPKFALKSGVLGASSQAAFDLSGRVSSFYLCNVGPNGFVDFSEQGFGDDICQLINIGTGQPYDQFYNLDPTTARSLVTDAINAVEQVSRQYSDGVTRVRVDAWGGDLPVGPPDYERSDVQCQDFMSPKECNIVFNVCDPVICPSSRCDLGGKYQVKDVVQSGVIGSTLLCLPNFPETKIPVCLTGVKAGLDSFISVEESFQQCLQQSIDTGESVGICDEIRSVYMCELVWRQALPFAQIAVPKLAEVALGQNTKGGGEYLGFQNALETAEGSIDYFTQSYAASSFESFKARSTDTATIGGDLLCKNFASVVFPTSVSGFVDTLTEPDSPPQYYGSFDEIPFTTITNPPTSQYKVFYHIFAGKDVGAYYSVYLKGTGGSFFQDTSGTRVVSSGYINKGEYATESSDFTAPSGYKQLCINVNGNEECGFKEVTTSFAFDYVKDEYVKGQLEARNVSSEEECVSGSISASSLLSLNLGESVSELIDPSIYEYGITRVCATKNPGEQTDQFLASSPRWVQVGTCGDPSFGCYLDTQSITQSLNLDENADALLDDINKDYQSALATEGNALTDNEFKKVVKEIRALNATEKIKKIQGIIPRVFYDIDKVTVLFLRGDAYGDIVKPLYEAYKEKELLAAATGKPGASQTVNDAGQLVDATGLVVLTDDLFDFDYVSGSCPAPVLTTDNDHHDPFSRMERLMDFFDGKVYPRGLQAAVGESAVPSCWDRAEFIFSMVAVDHQCVYTDGGTPSGPLVNILNSNGQVESVPVNTDRTPLGSGNCPVTRSQYDLKRGDLLSLAIDVKDFNGERLGLGHNVIFIEWIDKAQGKAKIFHGYNGRYGYSEQFLLKDGGDPVLQIWEARNRGEVSWNPRSAKLEAAKRSGSYDANKDFVDDLYDEGLLTRVEYDHVRDGNHDFGSDMQYLTDLLMKKDAADLAESNTPSPSASEGESSSLELPIDTAIKEALSRSGTLDDRSNDLFVRTLVTKGVITQKEYDELRDTIKYRGVVVTLLTMEEIADYLKDKKLRTGQISDGFGDVIDRAEKLRGENAQTFFRDAFSQGYVTQEQYEDVLELGSDDDLEYMIILLKQNAVNPYYRLDNPSLSQVTPRQTLTWTLSTAITEVEQRTGKATNLQNQIFLQELLVDGVITQNEYEDFLGIGGWFFNTVDEMKDVAKKLNEAQLRTPGSLRAVVDLDSAITEATRRSGRATDSANKPFIDKILALGLITQDEYVDILRVRSDTGSSLSMQGVLEFLEQKKLSSGQISAEFSAIIMQAKELRGSSTSNRDFFTDVYEAGYVTQEQYEDVLELDSDGDLEYLIILLERNAVDPTYTVTPQI